MQARYDHGNVIAQCPDCGAIVTFASNHGAVQFGFVSVDRRTEVASRPFLRVAYVLTRCSNCGRGGLARIHYNSTPSDGALGEFLPVSVDQATLPVGVPKDLVEEYREAERCMSIEAWRAASGLLRSTLEKTRKANGYSRGNLQNKIDDAVSDGVITAALGHRAHDDIRVLGNDVLHDPWRAVTSEEVEASHHYAQRVLEAFYDDRATVETILRSKNRVPPAPAP